MFAARRALHAKSHRSRYTGFYIAAVLFLLLQDFLLRPVLNFSPRGTRAFPVFSIFCNEKIAAPRRTRVTNSTKICRTSLVARYAAPPCVTRYAATYIASMVVVDRFCVANCDAILDKFIPEAREEHMFTSYLQLRQYLLGELHGQHRRCFLLRIGVEGYRVLHQLCDVTVRWLATGVLSA